MAQASYTPGLDRITRGKLRDLAEHQTELGKELAEMERRLQTVEGICEHWAKLGFDSAESELGRALGEMSKKVSQLEKLMKRLAKEAGDGPSG